MARKIFVLALIFCCGAFAPVAHADIATSTSSDMQRSSRHHFVSPSDLSGIIAKTPFHLRVLRLKVGANGVCANGFSQFALTPQGLTPAQIRMAYNLPSSGGAGTIALVEAYDNPNAESDLGAFDTQFGLASCTTGNGCFEKHKISNSLSTDQGWTLESDLDVQWAHAVAPGAKILLVEARSASLSDLLDAVDYARDRSDVVAVSLSWGAAEFSGEDAYDSHFVSPYGAGFFVASGDSGAGVEWPAASVNVTSVGGTTLTLASSTVSSEVAWSGSGGGISAYESAPGFQSTYGIPSAGGFRGVPDVAYAADPTSGFSIYDSAGYAGNSGWLVVGGTSAGAPQWAAIHALGHYATASSTPKYVADFRDITTGTNGTCGTVCTAQIGYDFVTGLGSPLVTNFSLPITYASVIGATGATDVSIDTTSATGGTGAWTNVSGPSVIENASGQVAAGTHTLTLPAGWEFNTAHPISVAVSGGTTLSVASTTITPSATSFSFSVTATSTTGTSTIAFSGIQVRPTGTTTPSFGTMTETGAAIAGIDSGTSFGSFSTDPGHAVSVGVEASGGGGTGVAPAQSLASGNQLKVYAITRDQFGNFITNASTTWSLISQTGGVATTDLATSTDGTNATLTGGRIGSAIIHAFTSGLTSVNSGIISITMGTTTSITLSPLATTTLANTPVTFTVQGADAIGNTSDVTASTTFAIDAGAGGSFAGSTYTPQNAGAWTVTATDGSA